MVAGPQAAKQRMGLTSAIAPATTARPAPSHTAHAQGQSPWLLLPLSRIWIRCTTHCAHAAQVCMASLFCLSGNVLQKLIAMQNTSSQTVLSKPSCNQCCTHPPLRPEQTVLLALPVSQLRPTFHHQVGHGRHSRHHPHVGALHPCQQAGRAGGHQTAGNSRARVSLRHMQKARHGRQHSCPDK